MGQGCGYTYSNRVREAYIPGTCLPSFAAGLACPPHEQSFAVQHLVPTNSCHIQDKDAINIAIKLLPFILSQI